MRAIVTGDNVAEIAHQISVSGENHFDFSGSVFNSFESIRQIFVALDGLPQSLEVKFHNCRIRGSEDLMWELRMDLMTSHIRDLELTDVQFVTPLKGQRDMKCMDYLVSGLCRNQWLRAATINGVSPNTPAVQDLQRKLATLSINGVETHQHQTAFFAEKHTTNGNGHGRGQDVGQEQATRRRGKSS